MRFQKGSFLPVTLSRKGQMTRNLLVIYSSGWFFLRKRNFESDIFANISRKKVMLHADYRCWI